MTVFFTRPVIICLSLLIDLNGFDKESNMIMQRVFCKMPGIILLTLIAGIATATEYTWTGGGGADTNWTTSANWGGAGYPHVSGDIAVVSAADTIALDASVALGRIYMDSATPRTVTVAGTGAADITVGGLPVLDSGFLLRCRKPAGIATGHRRLGTCGFKGRWNL